MALPSYVTIIFVFLLFSKTEANCTIGNLTKKVTCNSLQAFEEFNVDQQVKWTELVLENTSKQRQRSLGTDPFKNTPNLIALTITGLVNDIQPFSFRGLNNLESLWLEHNEVEIIADESFQCLGNIKSITVKNCGIKVIGYEQFNDLKNLVYLNLMSNKIYLIGDCAFCKLNNTILLLGNNSIVDFEPVRIFGETSYLTGINLDNNKIPAIPRFGSMPEFRGLVIGNNSIEKIENNAFEDCPNLQLLDVSSNKLKNIQANILSSNIQHEENFFLIIHNNKLQCVDAELREKISNIRRVTVDLNPWNCTCFADIIVWAKKQYAYVGCDSRGICNVSCNNNNGTSSTISFDYN